MAELLNLVVMDTTLGKSQTINVSDTKCGFYFVKSISNRWALLSIDPNDNKTIIIHTSNFQSFFVTDASAIGLYLHATDGVLSITNNGSGPIYPIRVLAMV